MANQRRRNACSNNASFVKPDFYDESDQCGSPFRVDPQGLADQRDDAKSSSSTVSVTEYADNCMDYRLYERAADAYNRARALGRDDFAVWHSLGAAYQFSGILDGAIYAHEEALARETSDDYWWGTSESLGLCLWKQGRKVDALVMFRQAVDKNPSNVMAWRYVHAACGLLGDSDSKAEAQQKLMILCEESNYHNTAALGYEELDEIDRAIALYEEATVRSPYPVLPWYSLGKAYLSLSRFEDSTRAFEQCLSCDAIPDRANLHAPAWTHRSYLYGVAGRYEESIHAAQSAVTYWESGTALANEGASHLAMGETANAIDRLEKAGGLRPDRPAIYRGLALAYGAVSRINEAQQAVRSLEEWFMDGDDMLVALD